MTFEQILKMSQSDLKTALTKELRNMGYYVRNRNGFIYAKGKVPVMLVAHLDTVHKELPTDSTLMTSKDGRYMTCLTGIGADDRSGVYMVLQILKHHKCHVLFCEDEEKGGIGAKAFMKSNHNPKVNYIVEIDRRGTDDCVFYDCDNEQFTEFVESVGFKTAHGTFSDISIIAPALKIAAVNISAGYFNEHTKGEYVDTFAMAHNIQRIGELVAKKSSLFKYVKVKRNQSYYQSLYDSDYTSYNHRYTRLGGNSYTNHTKHRKPYTSGYTGSQYDKMKKIQQEIDEDKVTSTEMKKAGEVYMDEMPDEYIITRPNGEILTDNFQYMLGLNGNVYEYFIDYDVAVKCEGYEVCDELGKAAYAKFAMCEPVKVVSDEDIYTLMEEDLMDDRSLNATWREVYNELGENTTLMYMDSAHIEDGIYPDVEDKVPDWVMSAYKSHYERRVAV